MAVVPLRSSPTTPAETAPAAPTPPKPIVVETDDDGSVTLTIGTSTARRPRAAPKPNEDFGRNLAEDMDDNTLGSLASYLMEGIESDEEDRTEWEETASKASKYMGVVLMDPASEVASDGTVCQAVATCMLEAAIKLWSTSYAELLPTGGPVKVERKDDGPTPKAPQMGHNGGPDMDAEPGQDAQDQGDAAGDDLADALERDLNWYLTTGDPGYYPDFSAMLMGRNKIGVAFREVYRCPIKKKPISRWIMAQDLIVQGNPAELTEGGRVTARKKVRQSTMRRMMKSGEYLDLPLVAPTGETSKNEIVVGQIQGINPTPALPRDFQHMVFECYCELGTGTNHDLFGDMDLLNLDDQGVDVGFPLPYRVSIDKDSRTVLAIRRNWKQGDEEYKVKPRFVKYGFIPGDGFYDLGLIHIVGNPTLAATMIQRSSVDSALFANFPAWMQAQGPASRGESTVYRPNVGEVVKIPVTGNQKLSDVVMPFPYKPPSPEAMALAQKLEGDVKSLAGIVDLPVGEGRIGNTPVGTIMSYIESTTMVPGAVHKADHTAQAMEFELLRELIAEEPEVLTRGNKNPARQWQVTEELLSPNLAPKADPNTPSQIHRLLKVQGLIMLGGLPQFAMGDKDGPIINNRAIAKKAIEVLASQDSPEYMFPPQPPQAAPPPPPDPRIVAAQIKAQSQGASDQAKLQGDQLNHQGKLAELQVTSQDKEADRQAANQREAMKAGVTKTKVGADMVSDAIGHAHDEASSNADRQHAATQQQSQQAHEQQQQLTAPLLAPDKDSSSP